MSEVYTLSHTKWHKFTCSHCMLSEIIDKMVVHNKQNTKYTNPLGFNTFMANSRRHRWNNPICEINWLPTTFSAIKHFVATWKLKAVSFSELYIFTLTYFKFIPWNSDSGYYYMDIVASINRKEHLWRNFRVVYTIMSQKMYN